MIFLVCMCFLSCDYCCHKSQQETNNSRDILCRYQPSEEDKEMYKNYKGDKSLLQQGDIFLMKVWIYVELNYYVNELADIFNPAR